MRIGADPKATFPVVLYLLIAGLAGLLLPIKSARAFSLPQDLQLTVRETGGVARTAEVVRSGVPLPASLDVWDPSTLTVVDGAGTPVPAEFRVLARWHAALSDATAPIQWLLVAFPVSVPANGSATYRLVTDGSAGPNPAPANPLSLSQSGNQFTVDTGAALFRFGADAAALFDEIRGADGTLLVQGGQMSARVNGTDSVHATTRAAWVEHAGPLSAVVVLQGAYDLPASGGGGLGSVRRYVFTAGSPTAVVRRAAAWEGDGTLRLVERVRDTLELTLASPRAVTAVGAFSPPAVTASVPVGQQAWVRQLLRAQRTSPLAFDVQAAGSSASGTQADGGMLAASTAAGAVAVALNHMHRYEPQALRLLSGGELALDLADDTARLASRQGLFATLAVAALAPSPSRATLDRQLWAPLNHPLRAWPDAAWFTASEAVDEVPVGALPTELAAYDSLVPDVLDTTLAKIDQKGLAGLMTFGVYPRYWGGSQGDELGASGWDGLFRGATWTDYHNTVATAQIWAMRSGEVRYLDEIAFPGALRTLHTQIMQCGPGDSWFYCGQAPAGYGSYRDDFNSSHAYFDNLFLYYWLTGDSLVVDTLKRGARSMREYLCTRRPASPCLPDDPQTDQWADLIGRTASQWIAAFRFVGLASNDSSYLEDYESMLARAATQHYVEALAGGTAYGFWHSQANHGAGSYSTDQLWIASLYDMNNLYRWMRDTGDAPIGNPPIPASRILEAWSRTLHDYGATVSGNGTAQGTWPNALNFSYSGNRLGGTLTGVTPNTGGDDPFLYDTGKANLVAVMLRAARLTADSGLLDLGSDLTQLTLNASNNDGSPLGKIQGLYLTRLHPAVALLTQASREPRPAPAAAPNPAAGPAPAAATDPTASGAAPPGPDQAYAAPQRRPRGVPEPPRLGQTAPEVPAGSATDRRASTPPPA